MIFELIIHQIHKTRSKIDLEDESLSEAIETIYSAEDYLIMAWHFSQIRLSMKYDVGEIIHDVFLMMNKLKSKETVQFSIDWPSSSFFASWEFTKSSKKLVVKAHWMAIHGGLKALKKINKEQNTIQVDPDEFIANWYNILRIIHSDLKYCGYSEGNLSDFKKLTDIVEDNRWEL